MSGSRQIVIQAYALSLTLLALVLFSSAAHCADISGKKTDEIKKPLSAEKQKSIGDTFSGEKFGYKVGFWYFTSAAMADISIEKKDSGLYVATLSAHTTGVLRFVPGLRHREDRYIAVLEEVDNGRRFRSVSFEESTTIGKNVRKRVTVFDYKKGVMTTTVEKTGKTPSVFDIDIPSGKYLDDPLCAFYNFRYGVYGPVVNGQAYSIRTYPRRKTDGEVVIGLRLGGEGEKGSIGEASANSYYAFLKLDKDLFSSASGDMEILFDSKILPKKAIAKNVLLFGDVYGELVNGN